MGTTETVGGAQTGDAEQIWFLDTLATISVSAEADGRSLSIIESLARRGDSPPLHLHEREDEAFYVLEGEVLVHLPDADLRLRAGDAALAPCGTAHTYRVESDTARWLAITNGSDLAQLVRSLGRPAERPELPQPSGPPTPEQAAAVAAAARQCHISLVGPPLG